MNGSNEHIAENKKVFFCRRGNLAVGPSKDEGAVCRKNCRREETMH